MDRHTHHRYIAEGGKEQVEKMEALLTHGEEACREGAMGDF